MKKAVIAIALLCIGNEIISLAVVTVLVCRGAFLLVKAAAEMR